MLYYFGLPAFGDVLPALNGAPAAVNFPQRLRRLSRALREQSRERSRVQSVSAEVGVELEVVRQIELSDEPDEPDAAQVRPRRGLRCAVYRLLGAAYTVSGLTREVTPDALRKLYEGTAWRSHLIPRPRNPRRT